MSLLFTDTNLPSLSLFISSTGISFLRQKRNESSLFSSVSKIQNKNDGAPIRSPIKNARLNFELIF
jgi:hypothetical protein